MGLGASTIRNNLPPRSVDANPAPAAAASAQRQISPQASILASSVRRAHSHLPPTQALRNQEPNEAPALPQLSHRKNVDRRVFSASDKMLDVSDSDSDYEEEGSFGTRQRGRFGMSENRPLSPLSPDSVLHDEGGDVDDSDAERAAGIAIAPREISPIAQAILDKTWVNSVLPELKTYAAHVKAHHSTIQEAEQRCTDHVQAKLAIWDKKQQAVRMVAEANRNAARLAAEAEEEEEKVEQRFRQGYDARPNASALQAAPPSPSDDDYNSNLAQERLSKGAELQAQAREQVVNEINQSAEALYSIKEDQKRLIHNRVGNLLRDQGVISSYRTAQLKQIIAHVANLRSAAIYKTVVTEELSNYVKEKNLNVNLSLAFRKADQTEPSWFLPRWWRSLTLWIQKRRGIPNNDGPGTKLITLKQNNPRINFTAENIDLNWNKEVVQSTAQVQMRELEPARPGYDAFFQDVDFGALPMGDGLSAEAKRKMVYEEIDRRIEQRIFAEKIKDAARVYGKNEELFENRAKVESAKAVESLIEKTAVELLDETARRSVQQ